MKRITQTLTALFVFIFSLSATAQTYTTKSYKLTIEGTSTMHDWTSTATQVTVQADLEVANGILEKINSATVTVPAKSIKSNKNSGLMDSRTHETLKADKFPNITYNNVRVTNVQRSGNEATITVTGNLTIAGVSKPTDLILKSKVLANGDVEISGSRKIKMTDHGIKPPVFMMGALKVGDEVKLDFQVVLQKK